LLDSKTENISEVFANFYDVVENSVGLGNILVHCSAGISRVNIIGDRAQH